MSIISIKDLTFTYPGAHDATLRHLDLEVEEGDFLAIMGANGCGKSTLCKGMNGLIPQFIAGDMTGSLVVSGLDARDTPIGELAQHVGYVYQDFENQLVRPTVLDEASFASLNYAQPDYLERGMAALKLCGLAEKAQDYVWALSGGQKHLLALAGALALEPEVIILDEPIAQLDPYHARQTYEVLRDLNEHHGKTIIVIEHHTDFIADYCKHAVLMANGAVSWKLPAREALRQLDDLAASDIYPPQIASAARELKRAGIMDRCIELPTTVDEGERAFAGLGFTPQAHSPRGDAMAGRLARPSEAPGAEPAVAFRDVHVQYRSVKGAPHTVFDGLDLAIQPGEKVALVGSNGAGKTTLLSILTGLLKQRNGEITFDGRKLTPRQRRALSYLVMQDTDYQLFASSVEEELSLGIREDCKEKVDAALEALELSKYREQHPAALSGGQKQRVTIGAAIVKDSPVIYFDEPTSGLDYDSMVRVSRLIEQLSASGVIVFVVSHDFEFIVRTCTEVVQLDDQGAVQNHRLTPQILKALSEQYFH